MIFFDNARSLPAGGFSPKKDGRTAIVIMRALPGLGDFLCVVPALRALRAAHPEAHIALIGLEGTQQLAARFNHYLDSFLAFPGYPGLKEQPVQIPVLLNFLAALHKRFDLALQMHGSGVVSNSFTMLLGAGRTAGFYLPGQYCPDEQSFLQFSENESEIRRCLRLMSLLGLPLQGAELEFPLREEDYAGYESLRKTHGLAEGRFVCLHPGASLPAKRWPPGCFAAVGDSLAEQGFQIVLTGSWSERSLTRATAEAMKFPAVDVGGHTSLGTMAHLLKYAGLLVCNDTGVSHLAAALRVPSVTIFQNSNPARWASLNRERHRIVVTGQRPENGRQPQESGAAGQAAITSPNLLTISAVLSEIDHLLGQRLPNKTLLKKKVAHAV